MAKFRKKPVIVDATRWHDLGGGEATVPPAPSKLLREKNDQWSTGKNRHWSLLTLDGWVGPLSVGDWIIKGPAKNEWYPCKPDIFEQTYQPVEESA